MAEHSVPLLATEGTFAGLAKQNLLFHQCVGELVDNAISARAPGGKFRVEISLQSDGPDAVWVYVSDQSDGMDLVKLKDALQLGNPPTSSDRLNEHGFGLKNSLATLSGNNGPWQIWTHRKDGPILSVKGPFKPNMVIDDDATFPSETFLSADLSTVVKVRAKMSYLQTVQGRGFPTRDLVHLRKWLVEHLGVMYRGFLEQDPETSDSTGSIIVSIGTDRMNVPAIQIPYANKTVKYLEVELGGQLRKLTYEFGTLDEEARDHLIKGERARFYYQGNIPTQGIDIRLGKRTIATRQLETVWATHLSRHNDFNGFVGELRIPELPRGILTTVNSKTDFNLDDSDWQKIFDLLTQWQPERRIREHSESELKKKWIAMLKATSPEDTVTDEHKVWPSGVAIDVLRKTNDKTIIYELKVGSATPQHLYQLRMYWDGLVLQGVQPSEGVLLVSDFGTKIEEMVTTMNQFPPPEDSLPYNFIVEKLKDRNLI